MDTTDRTDSPTAGQDSPDAAQRALDRLLAQALPPPALPEGFRAGLRRSIAAATADADAALRMKRAELELQQQREMAALRADYVRMRRDTLAMVLAAAFTAGAVAAVALPSLAEALDTPASTLAPVVTLLVVCGASLAAWVERMGWPRWR